MLSTELGTSIIIRVMINKYLCVLRTVLNTVGMLIIPIVHNRWLRHRKMK